MYAFIHHILLSVAALLRAGLDVLIPHKILCRQTSLNLEVNHQPFHLLAEQFIKYMVFIRLHIQCKCNAFAAQRRRDNAWFTHCASLQHFFLCVAVFLVIWY